MANDSKNLKIFFIKLISISITVIVVINLLFNLMIADKLKIFETISSLTELENRRMHGDNLRDDLNDLLKKDNLIKKEDKILLYKLYKKLKSEFEEIDQ